jgi:hypothetical protein
VAGGVLCQLDRDPERPGLPGSGSTLVEVAESGNAVKAFYGEDAGNKVAALLRDHILIAADLVKAAKTGEAAGQEAANKRWYQHADDLAALLSSANPN